MRADHEQTAEEASGAITVRGKTLQPVSFARFLRGLRGAVERTSAGKTSKEPSATRSGFADVPAGRCDHTKESCLNCMFLVTELWKG